ncbi:MAG: hypothetical protein UV60_C0002G0006 [Parcubacteria group bacterium GW2011_GWA2_43_11]|nr:MAG: hypothetical protein UV60_C0002G0006 [Parcubacteria group bacterium GW2011_GWA2_43_11]
MYSNYLKCKIVLFYKLLVDSVNTKCEQKDLFVHLKLDFTQLIRVCGLAVMASILYTSSSELKSFNGPAPLEVVM